MSTTKKVILFIHRWLGFVSGLIVFVISITGCIYCFHDEIQDVLEDHRKVTIQAKPLLKPSAFEQAALTQYPSGKVTSVVYYGPDRSVMVRLNYQKQVMAVFFNPYTGKVLHTEVFKSSFFALIKDIHLYLFLPKPIGKIVNGVSVIIFVIIMITGLVLWWPKRKRDRKRSFSIKWNGKWKRINYDLHNVLGFYVTAIVVVVAITGLSFNYKWVNEGLYTVANLGRTYPEEDRKFQSDSTAVVSADLGRQVIDLAYQQVRRQSPQAKYLLISPGASKGSALNITAYPQPLHFSYQDNYAFDKYSGKRLYYLPYAKKSAGLKLNNMNYDIHTGQIAGLPGKIIAFLCSLISATLPVTGLILYLGKKKPKKKRKLSKPAY